jgi:cell division septation protein DedD
MSEGTSPGEGQGGYEFVFNRPQFALVILAAALICVTFFVFGFKLGQVLGRAQEQPEGVSGVLSFPDTPTPRGFILEMVPLEEAAFTATPRPLPPTRTPEPIVSPLRAATPTRTPRPTQPPTKPPTKKPTTPPTPAPQSAQAGVYTIQIGSFGEKANAARMLARVMAAGYEADVHSVEIGTDKFLHRVWVGRYPTREAAERQAQALRDKGFPEGLVMQVKEE